MSDLSNMTATELAYAIKEKQVGIEELTKVYLQRIEKYDGIAGLNSIAELNHSVLLQARELDSLKTNNKGPMFGLPVLVKDNIDVQGLHTTAGSLALTDNIASCDAPIIKNLRRSGALILGKTNMTEFANYTTVDMPAGYSSRGGQVKNAYNQEKSPSGSSSGSAVAMSAGFCAAAIGTDTSFSIVGCVTENGVTGLKPSPGVLPHQGIIPIARTLDSAGPITRTLADSLLVYSSMLDTPFTPVQPMKPKELRLAVNTCNQELVSDAQLGLYDDLFNALRKEGTEITEVIHEHTPLQRDIMRCEFRAHLEDYLSYSNTKNKTLDQIINIYEAHPKSMMKYGISFLKDASLNTTGKLSEAEYLFAISERTRLRAQIIKELSPFDACVMTGPTNIMHFIGLPSVALKLGLGIDGTPRGIILYGSDEQRLFAAALCIEKYCLPIPMPTL